MMNRTTVYLRLALFFCLFSSIFQKASSNVLVISDIDDTIKTSNSMGKIFEAIHYFLQNKPYYEMRDIFVEIEKDADLRGLESHFFYVTAAPRLVFNATKFLNKYHFPLGPVTMKKMLGGQGTYQYKIERIREILTLNFAQEYDQIYFFGDNSSYDAEVYHDLVKEFGLKNASIFIRDVKTNASKISEEMKTEKLENVFYYLSEAELIGHPALGFLTSELKQKIIEKYSKGSLIPAYTSKTYFRRAHNILKCKIFHSNSKSCMHEKKKKAQSYWKKFHKEVLEIVKVREGFPAEKF